MARKFDRFMVDVNVGTNRKLRRLSVAERLCHLTGVLPVAAQAPIRGRLLVGDSEAEPRDFAELAGVSIRVALSTITKLREVGIIVKDDENQCEMVHDWADWNPSPKEDRTNVERQRRFQDRRRAAIQRQREIDSMPPKDIWDAIVRRDGAKVCGHCGATEDLTIDHIKPRVLGGDDHLSNLRILCRKCNSSKQHREAPSEWIAVSNAVSNGDANGAVTPGREEKRREENTPQPPEGGERGKSSSRKSPRPPTPDSLPGDLPTALCEVAPFVVDSLRRLAEAKGAKDVTLAAVGRTLAAYPEHDHRRIVGDVEHYWVHGDGQTSIVRDAVLTYRNRLSRVPAGRTAALRAVPAVESSAEIVARMSGGAA